jgi:DNA-binding NtrC family response regulator
MKILIVDDESVELFISKRFLGMEFQVEGFNSVPEAVQWAKNNSFDILVSDFNLAANVFAHDLLKALLEVKGPTFKAYVLTNYVDDTQAATLRSAGFHDIIEKPLSLAKFKAAAGL